MDAREEHEWCRAQNIQFTAGDLVPAAKEEIVFLASVHSQYPSLYQGPFLLAAIRRYLKYWLPLVAELDGYGAPGIPLVPPLECSWIWHCHRLNPVAYEKDCERLFGRVLDAPLVEASMKEIAADGSAYIWNKRYPEHPYRIDPRDFVGLSDADAHVCFEETEYECELKQAVYSQRDFYYQVSGPQMVDDRYLKHGVERYKAFLYLIAKHSREVNMECHLFVPTCDIDLIWHTHQLKVEAYREDMFKLVGRVQLNHNDHNSEGISIRQRFNQTKDLWEKTFSLPYERAGATYRCDMPNPLPKLNLSLMHTPVIRGDRHVLDLQFQQGGYLKKRIITEVHLEILRGKHIPIKGDRNFFVRMKILRKCPDFKADTVEMGINSTNTIYKWKQSWMIECETSTNGVSLELRSRPKGFVMGKVQGSKLIGCSTLEWQRLLESPRLSVNKWVVALPSDFPKDQQDVQPMLHIAASTIPVRVGAYLLRMVGAIPTDDNGETLEPGKLHSGRWISRTVLDHTNAEIFVVRAKFLEGVIRPQSVRENAKVIHIHQGGWRYNTSHPTETKHGRAQGEIIGSAQQLMNSSCDEDVLRSMRQWSLFNGAATLTVSKHSPVIELQGDLGYPMKIYRGRRVEYQVEEASSEDETSFVTIVRFLPNAPLGKATALFNWRTGAMEVTQEENVVLVVLLMATIAISMYDMSWSIEQEIPVKYRKDIALDTNEWGCVVVNKNYWYNKNPEEINGFILGGMIENDQKIMNHQNDSRIANQENCTNNKITWEMNPFELIGATLEIITLIVTS